jgi:hypothetical protein
LGCDTADERSMQIGKFIEKSFAELALTTPRDWCPPLLAEHRRLAAVPAVCYRRMVLTALTSRLGLLPTKSNQGCSSASLPLFTVSGTEEFAIADAFVRNARSDRPGPKEIPGALDSIGNYCGIANACIHCSITIDSRSPWWGLK